MTVMYIDNGLSYKNAFTDAIKLVNPSIKIIHAENGVKALEALSSKDLPDYIFLNSSTSRTLTEITLCAIRNVPALRRTKIIIFSASLDATEIEEYKKMGVSTFLAMPDSVPDLHSIISILFRLN